MKNMSEKEFAIEKTRTELALRQMTKKIRQHFSTIERRMYNRQKAWGGDVSVINEETSKRSAMIRRSLAFEYVMLNMPIEIEDHEIIVGSCLEDDTVVRCAMPIFSKIEEYGKCSIAISHKCPDYYTLVNKGLRQILSELEGKISKVKAIEYDDIRAEKLDFIEACLREGESAIKMANRFAHLAKEKAAKTLDPERKKELLDIAEVCSRVPEHPARTMREALQAIWFLNYAYFETESHLSIGTIDRIVAPFFYNDLNTGRITLELAQELVDSFCLNVNNRAQIDPTKYYLPDQMAMPGTSRQHRVYYGDGFVTSLENDDADAINHWGQNILISGLDGDGKDVTSPVTYMFLNAHEKISMTSPVLSVRLHKNSPPELVSRVAEVLKTGGGMPYINNDDIIIAAYERLGVPRADGSRYANSNCWETLLMGMSNQEMIRQLNFLYFLELAINRGRSFIHADNVAKRKKSNRRDPLGGGGNGPDTEVVDGADCGSADTFEDFNDLIRAWRVQCDVIMRVTMENVARTLRSTGSHGQFSSIPILSLLMQDCVDKVADVTHRGAKYDIWHLMAEAVSNAADAAAVIKKFVFEEKQITLPKLVELLKDDYKGSDGEEWRQRFINEVPKFGNDKDYVDSIARDMVAYFLERAEYHSKKYPDIIFSPCIGTFSWVISIGKRIGASADGRKCQAPISANMSPEPGRDLSGPLAAINSYLKINTSHMAAGAPIDLRLSSTGLEGENGTNRVVGLIKTFLQSGGNMMTLTTTSVQELKKAMETPEKYRGLRVRMGGWSVYYVLLSKESQKLHLRRVEHGF